MALIVKGVIVKFHRVTDRTQIVLLQPGLAPLLADYRTRNRAHLGPWEPPRHESYYTLKQARVNIAAMLELYETDQCMPLVVLDAQGQKIIATVNVSNIVRGIFQAANLGYGLDGQLQGQGYMTEILTAAVPALFDHLHLHRLMANYIPSNHRSGAVLERVGFEKEGLAKNYLFINGKWQDHILTARINPDFSF